MLNFLSLTPSHLLKITKFLDEISQFKFLVKADKKIFVYKLLLSLNISDFSLFLCQNCTPLPPLEKSRPLFPNNPPLKIEILSSPLPLWKFGRRLNFPLPAEREGEGAHYEI